MGVISPAGNDLRTYWDNLLEGRSAVRAIERFAALDYACHFGAEVRDFDPGRWMDRREARRLDRYAQFGIAASDLALTDAGLKAEDVDPRRGGVAIGSGVGGLLELDEQHRRLIEKGPSQVSPFLIPKMMANAAAGLTSIRLGWTGPCVTTATACASAGHSIGFALRAIQRGDADAMIAGGSEAPLAPIGMAGFGNMKALSTRNASPERASRPFDKGRDGFVMGEGAGILMLEEEGRAVRRGARIYAELSGFGMTGDGHHITAPRPDGSGAAEAMRCALADASCPADGIDYINAHGTSTPVGDKAEAMAIHSVFGARARSVWVSSTKSILGHLLGASGGVEMVATVLSLHEGKVHPTINHEEPDPECDIDCVPNAAREKPLRAALCNSFGFGGHNVALCARAYRA
ncbi:MAG: beta-ketoacyl-ACP synthase II [Planctomycetes bacterium]|nr:beta-ketoacyl-ACP synthase II [Planctomycetota bacterium]